jgi:hypothetical protein
VVKEGLIMCTLIRGLLGFTLLTLTVSQAVAQTGTLPVTPIPVGTQNPSGSLPAGPPMPMPFDPRNQVYQMPINGNPPVGLGAPVQLGQPQGGIVPPPPPPPPVVVAPPPPANPWAPATWTPVCRPAGFYIDAGIDIMSVDVSNHLSGTVPLPSGNTTVALPGTHLDWTAMPTLALGYRLPDGLGAFALSYRFIVSEGHDSLDRFDGTDELRSRLSINIIDLDYRSNVYEPFPRLEVQGILGARIGISYYDTQLMGAITDDHESNYYVGAGPHAAVELNRRLPLVPGLALTGKIDGAVLVGNDNQRFSTLAFDAFNNGNVYEMSYRRTDTSEMLAIEAGLSYRPPDLEALRFSTGYRYEQWWNMGRGGSADLTTNGFFIRVEYGF